MRLLVRLITALVTLAIAAGGALLAVEVGWAWLRPGAGSLLVPWQSWLRWAAAFSWHDTEVRIAAALLVVAGLLLLLVSASARRRQIRLHDPADDVSVVTSPRSLARLVGGRVRAQDGVGSASVTASAKVVRVRATSRMQTEQQLAPSLTELAGAVVDELPLPRKPRVSVVVDSPKDRR